MKTLTHKQRILLNVVDGLSEKGKSSRFMVVKNLFLLAQEERVGSLIKFYNFFPYKYGPFSNVCYTDISKLENGGLLIESGKHLALTDKGKQASMTANRKASLRANRAVNRFNSDREIREYVYGKYPEYTVKSELITVPQKQVTPGIFTIGYEGKDIDLFLNNLIQNNIDILIDVRKNPFSMSFNFTKQKLNNFLIKSGIQYLHIPELGIEGKLRDNLSTLKEYQNLFKQYEITTLKTQTDEIKHIVDLGKIQRVALMCFEANKDFCHRGTIAEYIERLHELKVFHL